MVREHSSEAMVSILNQHDISTIDQPAYQVINLLLACQYAVIFNEVNVHFNVKVKCTGAEPTKHQSTDGTISIHLSDDRECSCSIKVQFPDGGYGHEGRFHMPEFIGKRLIQSNVSDAGVHW